MNVLIIGSGGREHALAWKISQSSRCGHLYVAPGNAGTGVLATNVEVDIANFEALHQFCEKVDIHLIVVGPEQALVDGIVDFFIKKKIPIIGPDVLAARLEGSKAYAKEFMQEFDIPTAAYRVFDTKSMQEGKTFIDTLELPIVLKADGLAAGKGVLILDSYDQAKIALKEMLEGKFGLASQQVVVEEFLEGLEFSVFVLLDGDSYKILPIAKDYKRIGEGDTGLNTGGMGAVSPVEFVDKDMMQKVEDQIIKPTMRGIQKRDMHYRGILFIGLINVAGSPKVIEYNCRLGDPETEVILPRIETDLLELFDLCWQQRMRNVDLRIDPRTTSTVMLVSGGYPEQYEKGKLISNLENVSDCISFHAGTKLVGDEVYTNGGRVLALTAYGTTKEEALHRSYKAAEAVQFDGKYYRKDIGFDI